MRISVKLSWQSAPLLAMVVIGVAIAVRLMWSSLHGATDSTAMLIALLAVGAFALVLAIVQKMNWELAADTEQKISDCNHRIEALKLEIRQMYLPRKEAQDYARTESVDGIRRAIERLQTAKAFPGIPDVSADQQHHPMDHAPSWERSRGASGSSTGTAFSTSEGVTVFYARLPEPEGTFKASELCQEAAWDTLYILKVDVRTQSKATIDINSNPDRFQAAIQAPQQYLSPACEYETNPPSGSTCIMVLNPGSAVLDGAHWRIEKKLRIRFS